MNTLVDWLWTRWWICYARADGLVMNTLVDWLCTRWWISYVHAGGLLCARWWIGYVHAGEYNHSGSVKLAVCTQAGDCVHHARAGQQANGMHKDEPGESVAQKKTSSARWSVDTKRTGDRYMLGFSLTPRLLRSPILCRLCKGPFQQTYKP